MKKRIRIGRIIFLFSIVLFIIFIILISPIFNIRSIEISGNNIILDSQILASLNINLSDNILSFSISNAKRRIENIPRIRYANISRSIPDRIYINIIEREAIASIPFNNRYIILDNDAVVIDILDSAPYNTIIVNGLIFSNFGLGLYLEIQNEQSWKVASLIYDLFSRNNFFPNNINLYDINDIQLEYGEITILFGNTSDLNRKIAASIAILEGLSEENMNIRGFIHIQDINISPRFGLSR